MSSIHFLRTCGLISSKTLKSLYFTPLKRCFAFNFGNGNGNHHTNPDCIKLDCDPKIERQDKKSTTEMSQLKHDQIGTYRSCPPPVKKMRVKCDDLPPEPQPPRRKRKPFVPAAACKKPTVSLSATSCEKIKKDKCPIVQMPNCPKARVPPKCVVIFKRPDCKRKEYAFPAFSACYKMPKKNRFDECECLDRAELCF